MANKISFLEGIVISWRNELKRGDPWRIIRFVYAPRVIARALTGDTDWRK